MSTRETRDRLKNLKVESAEELGMTQYLKENRHQYKGDQSAWLNGSQGGPIGGLMVKKIISIQEAKLAGQNG